MALEKCTFHRIKRAKADLENSIFNDINKKTTKERQRAFKNVIKIGAT